VKTEHNYVTAVKHALHVTLIHCTLQKHITYVHLLGPSRLRSFAESN